ncbi:MAG: heme-binding protein [Polaromonas sp.]|nr:heme-binding protein [Polaromonas sp.]
MPAMVARLGGIGLACVVASSASAQVLSNKDVSAALAVTIAQTAIEACKAQGYRTSATVVGRLGEVIVQIRGDGTGPHTMACNGSNATKKTHQARG